MSLLNEGFVAPGKARRARATPDRLRTTPWRARALRWALNLAALGALAAAVLFMPQSRIELRRNSEQVLAEAAARLRANRLVTISQALDIYRVEQGAYPDALEGLVEQGLLEPRVLRVPGPPVEYVSVGDDYDLR